MHSNPLLLALVTGLGFLSGVQAARHLVDGLSVPSQGDVPLRRDINDLQKEAGPQWDLYIQALKAMQDMNPDDELSYFKTAGIHGKPYIEWGDAGPEDGDGWLGYCPHGELLFLSWHRPYILLFEEQLVRHAAEIASNYPESVRDKYVQAAHSLRAPYWDWAADSAVPSSTVPSTVTINVAGKNGVKPSHFSNPLKTYKMPKDALKGRWGPFDSENRPETIRCPGNYPRAANDNLRSRNLKDNLYACFVYAQDFAQFSQTGNSGVGIEQIHNWIHYDAACNQQFSNLELAGFDPLFMLHHTNVDRLWAYWQYMKPDQALFSDSYEGGSRFSTPSDTEITPDSPLPPFYTSESVMHTSRSVSSIQNMGYSYQGLAYWNMTADELKRSATTFINTEYGAGSIGGGGEVESNSQTMRNGRRPSRSWTRRQVDVDSAGTVDMTAQFFVRIELERAHVHRPSTVNVYFGEDHKAGSVVVMHHPKKGIMRGSFAVDDYIRQSYANAPKTNGSTTLSSMAKAVRLEVVKHNGSRIPISSISSLKVTLEEIPFTPPKSVEELPIIGKPIFHNVTIVEKAGSDRKGH